MPVRITLALACSIEVAVMLGCGPSFQVTRDEMVGQYLYRDSQLDSTHGPDTLTLRVDGHFVLVHLPSGTREEGDWWLADGGATLELGSDGAPIEATSTEIRIILDYDTGAMYIKRLK